MKPLHIAVFVLAAILPNVASTFFDQQPQQIHLNYGVQPSEMIVTWVTVNMTNTPTVEYGSNGLDLQVQGKTTIFVDGGSKKHTLYIHRVVIGGLTPGARYIYHCGSTDGWSALYFFSAMMNGTDWSPRFAVYGDMGNENAQSLTRLQEEVQRGMYDAILHVGDMAYNLDSDNARIGDEFMRQIEPIAAYVAYQTCVGNHEQNYNFSNYVNRFSMVEKSGKINNHFYSFDIGPAHIIALSTEFYYFVQYGWRQIVEQYLWLEKDLKEASKPENRAQRPWIITMGHRPMYCSSDDGDDCTHKESIVRKGIPLIHAFGLEDLFYKYGVDLEIWAHEHVYERLWPVYDRQVYNGSYDAPYTNPKAPVHIITGSAGCNERHDPFVPHPAEWSALRNADYGYTRMTIFNKTHLGLQQVSDDQGGAIIDEITIIKDQHGPEAWL